MSDMRCLCEHCTKIKCERHLLRFHAACAAMQGIWASTSRDVIDLDGLADVAVKQADALLERLEKS
jgi:hypothetical protein